MLLTFCCGFVGSLAIFLACPPPGKVLPIAGDEEISSVLAVDNFREDEYLVLLTQVKDALITKPVYSSAPRPPPFPENNWV